MTYHLVVAALAFNNYLLFVLGAKAWFIIDRPSKIRMNGLIAFCLGSTWLHLCSLLTADINLANAVAAAIMLIISETIFVYNVMASPRLTGAYSTDTPMFLNRTGLYRWMRHPFYSSYLLTLVVPVVVNPSWLLCLHFVTSFLVYNHTARGEEEKFLASPLAEEYREYMTHTARFMPGVY